MQTSEYKKCKAWLSKQTYPSEGGFEDAKQNQKLKGTLYQFPHFLSEKRGQTIIGEAHMARLGMYIDLIPGAICNYMYLKYKEINIQNTLSPPI